MELAVEFKVEVVLDFLVEPSDHLPNALLNRFAGRSPLPKLMGAVDGLSGIVLSCNIDATTVEASLWPKESVTAVWSLESVKTNSSFSFMNGFLIVVGGVIGLESSLVADLHSDCT